MENVMPNQLKILCITLVLGSIFLSNNIQANPNSKNIQSQSFQVSVTVVEQCTIISTAKILWQINQKKLIQSINNNILVQCTSTLPYKIEMKNSSLKESEIIDNSILESEDKIKFYLVYF